MSSYEWPPSGGGGSGTLTSVGLADGSSTPIYLISNSPVTTTGTLTFTLGTQTANKVFAGPTTGSAAQPTFRSLVAADFPFTITNLTDAGTDGIVIGNGTGAVLGAAPVTIAQHVADTTHNGYLSSTDWNTFNGKQAAGSYITALTGDVTAAGPGSVSAALTATTNATLTTISSLVSVGTITTGTWSATTIAINKGGTGQVTAAAAFNALSPITTTGDMIYSPSGATSQRLAVGSTGNVLTVAGGVPSWAPPATSGTVTSVAQTVPAFLSISGSPITGSGTLAIGLSGTALPIANGGTAVTSVTTAPIATSFAGWDANKNLRANMISGDLATTVTAAGTTTLTVASKQDQQFTGTTTQTVVMPDATTLVIGQGFTVLNRSTGNVTVNANGGGLLQTMVGGSQAIFTVVTVGTSAGTWDVQYSVSGIVAAVQPTIQKFTSSSGTYTTPSGVQYIRVRMVGGGGAGGSTGAAAANGGDGGNTTFGSSLLTANGGQGGRTAGGPSTGGSGSLGSGPIGTALTGGQGAPSGGNIAGASGGSGASTPFGGQGVGALGGAATAGNAAATNTGSGGGGASVVAGSGAGAGGAGGFVDAIITSPSATYTYAVAAAGAAGAGANPGGAGGSGYIEVTEYYTNFSVGSTTTVAAGTFLAGPTSGSAAAPTFRALQVPTIQSFASGSGTYTTPAGVLYLIVEVVGGGGGGGGSGTTSGTASTDGSDSTFSIHSGAAILTAGKGLKGSRGLDGGAGGAATIAAGATKLLGSSGSGGGGGASQNSAATTATPSIAGGVGGNSGGGGGGGFSGASGGTAAGGAAATNSGGGGGGGATNAATSNQAGSGGGGGAYIKALITSPSASYDYSVGAKGTGQAAGTSGNAGGDGGSGYIVVQEFYQ